LQIIFRPFFPLERGLKRIPHKGVRRKVAENNFVKVLIPLKGVLKKVLFIGVRLPRRSGRPVRSKEASDLSKNSQER
jgi:hypothetical protein